MSDRAHFPLVLDLVIGRARFPNGRAAGLEFFRYPAPATAPAPATDLAPVIGRAHFPNDLDPGTGLRSSPNAPVAVTVPALAIDQDPVTGPARGTGPAPFPNGPARVIDRAPAMVPVTGPVLVTVR